MAPYQVEYPGWPVIVPSYQYTLDMTLGRSMDLLIIHALHQSKGENLLHLQNTECIKKKNIRYPPSEFHILGFLFLLLLYNMYIFIIPLLAYSIFFFFFFGGGGVDIHNIDPVFA